jgi:hypothetical protein
MGFSTSVKPSYDGNRKTIKKIPEAGLIARVLPPLHSCAEQGPNAGKWAIMHKQHFGYDTPRGDSGKERNWNTFYCVEVYDWKTKTIIENCDACDVIRANKDLYDITKKQYEAEKVPADQIKAALEPLKTWNEKHNLDAKWYINIKTLDGEYSTLKIGTKLKKKLDALIGSLRAPTTGARPVDPLDPEDGLWLQFTRTGKGFDVDYDVQVAFESKTIEIDGTLTEVKVVRRAPLADDEKELAEVTTFDLSDIGIRRLPRDKVTMLVQSDGSPDAIDAIFASSERVAAPKAVSTVAPVRPVVAAPQSSGAKLVVEKAEVEVTPTSEQLDAVAAEQRAKAAVLVAAVAAVQPVSRPLSTEPGPRPGPKPVVAPLKDFGSMSLADFAATIAPKK